MAKRGRKQKVIDEVKLEQLASINSTIEDMARQLGCCRDILENRYRKLIDECRAKFRARILLAQLKAAEKGNPALLIWLGKQHLGQADSPQKIDQAVKATCQVAIQVSDGRIYTISPGKDSVGEVGTDSDSTSTT